MSHRERRAIIRAMTLIHADEENGGDYSAGMDMLAKLAGLPTTFSEIMKGVQAVSFEEIAAHKDNSQFTVLVNDKKEPSNAE